MQIILSFCVCLLLWKVERLTACSMRWSVLFGGIGRRRRSMVDAMTVTFVAVSKTCLLEVPNIAYLLIIY